MSQFYELFYQICNTIHEYNTNSSTRNDLGNITTKCSQIYNKIDKCDSYINLLKIFKKTYDKFRDLVITRNTINNLGTVIQELKPEISADAITKEF
ncbi:Plasmodium variant antigen protein Cir/Yir/Bir, putative [Plasmodium berghei]|uniref:Plasmodium variant antigen protein Cir/Yir/Bir, putative n=1 Tax=Plasmodium berghei TaxID=5821 RepID=A0A113PCQ4_PLABE|nr:Plasmodium variant antigen protein Cir/Yir/Bir, putative [Plasmodium berghei]CXH85205.1 Plasmodium variant antigen protein Cir/Yir/Bir, putative [Plasmodium berghei]CXI84606.1 Plasmodium variant antigen protein Cir/Yir/Bir, putative [Plasmodium berghei]SBW38118.1 Plasmodium variant antigen protein Cir/Yir/Bir, putative [Plasmodium berghei]SCL81714.1 Plasmodium variant antigen protein Cir/Yir/Bir, putative [Plasmodium berghei]